MGVPTTLTKKRIKTNGYPEGCCEAGQEGRCEEGRAEESVLREDGVLREEGPCEEGGREEGSCEEGGREEGSCEEGEEVSGRGICRMGRAGSQSRRALFFLLCAS